jgi:hypothetical protein
MTGGANTSGSDTWGFDTSGFDACGSDCRGSDCAVGLGGAFPTSAQPATKANKKIPTARIAGFIGHPSSPWDLELLCSFTALQVRNEPFIPIGFPCCRFIRSVRSATLRA